MSMTLEQMEAIATDLDERVARLEKRKEAASYAPQNSFFITNTGATSTTSLSLTAESFPKRTVVNKGDEGGRKVIETIAAGEQPRLFTVEFFIVIKPNVAAGASNSTGFWVQEENGKKEKLELAKGGLTVTKAPGEAMNEFDLIETSTVLLIPESALVVELASNATGKITIITIDEWVL